MSRVVALNGGSTMSAPTPARGGKAEMLRMDQFGAPDPKRHLHCRRTAVNCCIAKGLFDHFVGAGDHRNAE